MKKRKSNISKKCMILLLPFCFVMLVISLSLLLSGRNCVITEQNETQSKTEENETTVTVLFHKTGEIKTVNLEEYLMGVVPAEMPPSFNFEALKAQAVAARTYIINRTGVENETHKNASVCTDSTHCKAYMSDEDSRVKWGSEWDKSYRFKIEKAVLETKGKIITYMDEPISAVFHSTSSGKTENSEDVWQNALPYLRSVVSEGEEKSPRFNSEVVISTDDFKNKMTELDGQVNLGNNPEKWIGNITYNDSGSVKNIHIGSGIYKGTQIRNTFGLRSSNFKITVNEGKIIFSVTGNGHGVGMSQYGANHAAENGYTYEQILKKYYTGVEIKNMNNI